MWGAMREFEHQAVLRPERLADFYFAVFQVMSVGIYIKEQRPQLVVVFFEADWAGAGIGFDRIYVHSYLGDFESEIIEGIFGRDVGALLVVLDDFSAFETCDFGRKLHTGRGVYVCFRSFYLGEVRLVRLIGCLIGRAGTAGKKDKEDYDRVLQE